MCNVVPFTPEKGFSSSGTQSGPLIIRWCTELLGFLYPEQEEFDLKCFPCSTLCFVFFPFLLSILFSYSYERHHRSPSGMKSYNILL